MRIGFIALKNILLSENFVDMWTSKKEVEAYKRLYTCPNLGLLTVAALTDNSFEVKYIDENFTDISYDEAFDLVCLSPVAQQVSNAYNVASKFREKGIPVVMGGIHASVLPQEVKENADCVVIGEAEEIWNELIQDFKSGMLRPFYKSDKQCNLEKSPIPRYSILENPSKYKLIPVQVTRGCPHDCEFCASSKLYGKEYRHKSVQQIVNEINAIKEIWKSTFIYFTDDNMLVDRKFTKELLKALIPLKIRWFAFSDISIGEDEELLSLLSKSGCVQITFGLESLSSDNLSIISKWKQRKLSQYPELIKKIQSYGIGAFGSFVVGLDNDDITVFERIRNFVIENNLFGTSFTILTPFPGTRLYQKFVEENRIIDRCWDHYTCFNVVYRPKLMTVEELNEGFKWLYKEVYSEQVTLNRMKHFKRILVDKGTLVK